MTSTRTVVLRPSAKVNLTLSVGPRRADGYHDVRTLLQSIGLSDTLTIAARSGPLRLQCRTSGVPSDRSNLVWRAADALWQAMGRSGDPRGVHLKLEKAIPSAAGLGGGSADAAAALVGLNKIWEGRIPRRELMRLAVALGSDVPFFLQGGTALGVGRGEELYPVDDVARLGVLIIKPSFGVATADAYAWLDMDREAGLSDLERAAAPVEVGWPIGPLALTNDLAGPVGRRHPEVAAMLDACLAEGALGAAMTGSGSAVYGLFPEAAAKRAAQRVSRPNWLVQVTRTLTRREAARRVGL